MEQAHKLVCKTPDLICFWNHSLTHFPSQINESGLKIFSIEDLQNAAEKSVQFSKVVKMAREIDVGVEFTLGI
jgi:succinyl-CoA synthetase beta subunit